jgi:hypothetical protein
MEERGSEVKVQLRSGLDSSSVLLNPHRPVGYVYIT